MKVYQNSVDFRIDGRSVKCMIKGYVEFKDGSKVSLASTSVANCHPDDEFDFKVGSRLAESRASLGIYKQAERAAEAHLMKVTTELDDEISRANDLISKEKLHLIDLLKNV